MAQYTIIKMTEMSPLHVGTGKENYDFSSSFLHSDTISAALAALRASGGKDTDVREFLNSFSVSSAYPFFESSLFLPKPQGRLPISVRGREEQDCRKSLKNVKFIELPIWNEIIQGKSAEIDEEQLQGDFITKDASMMGDPYKNQVMERVTVPRDGDVASPFYFEWRFFSPEGGLFCLVDARDDLLTEIVGLFSQLGETGLGTDKNVGGGKFKVTTGKIAIDEPSDATHQLLLSMFIPTRDDMSSLDLSRSKYELVQRGGFIAGSQHENLRHLRKKSIYMFAPGSILCSKNTLSGKVVDLRPEWNDTALHPVYRSGKPIFLPIKTIDV